MIVMLSWSKYFQNPTYLELTRKYLISEELRPVILNYCGIHNEAKVLDVGCGTGYFSRFIAEGNKTVHVVGLEFEQSFIEYAQNEAKEKLLDIAFIQGDALHLPFEDESFDAVTSHTFLTSVSDTSKSLKEMIRVCKKGGTISSITAMSFVPSIFHNGYYNRECIWAVPLARLSDKMWRMYEAVNPIKNYMNSTASAEIPHLFAISGLKEISAYPIGKLFSLSNALISYEERVAYLDQTFESESQKLDTYLELKEARELFSEEDAREYLTLLEQKHNYYKTHPMENEIWEWTGGANVLISGKRKE